jgi:hypothetical protein
MYPTLQLGKFQFRFRLVLMDILELNIITWEKKKKLNRLKKWHPHIP